ncbi:MAG: hypothetical protein QHI48_02520 [Bacteroidota bacterium]|nr:hypothetical protein [Bacteroidota bacterium]
MIPGRPFIAVPLGIGALLVATLAGAQEKPQPPSPPAPTDTARRSRMLSPLSFPEFIITGNDVLRFENATKEIPAWYDPSALVGMAGRGSRISWNTVPSRQGTTPTPTNYAVDATTLLARASYGSYGTPALESWFGRTFFKGDMAASARLEHSDGHVPRSSYDRYAFALSGGSYFPSSAPPFFARSRVSGEGNVRFDGYSCYGDPPRQDADALDFTRDALRLGARGEIHSRRNRIIDYSLRAGIAYTSLKETVSVRDSIPLAESSFLERAYSLEGCVRIELFDLPIDLSSVFAAAHHTETTLNAQHTFFFSSSASSRYSLAKDFTLQGMLGLYFSRGSIGSTAVRIYPALRAEYSMTDRLTLSASWRSAVENLTFRDLLDFNPYVTAGPEIRPRDIHEEFALGAAYVDRGSFRVTVTGSFKGMRNVPLFLRNETPGERQWKVRYEGYTAVTELRGELLWDILVAMNIHAALVFRDSRNTVLEQGVPYLPNGESSVRCTYLFPFGLRTWCEGFLLGTRPCPEGALPSVLLVHLGAEYRILRSLGVFLEFRNVLDKRYEIFRGYRALPFTATAGISYRL